MMNKMQGSKTVQTPKRLADSKTFLTTSIPVIVLLLIVVFFQIISDGQLLSSGNLKSLLNNIFSIAIGAAGVSFLMAQGNLDLSLGGIVGLSAAISGLIAEHSAILSLLSAIAIGVICGLLNGIIHTKFRIASIITTMSTAFIFKGIQCTILESGAIGLPASMMSLENRQLKAAIMLFVLVLCGLIYTHYRFGKYARAIGSRAEASHQSGVRVDLMKILAFVIAGSSAGLVGFFNLIRAASVSANTGSGFEFNVLLAVLVGGMPISGGSGTKFRSVVIGSLIMVFLSSGMTLWGLQAIMERSK